MRARLLLGFVFTLVVSLGCSGAKKFAPVSGTVILNGKALAGATVTFEPIADKGSIEAGDSSSGKTNEKGEYTLTSTKGKLGAQVGKHQVSVSLLKPQIGEDDKRPPRGGWKQADLVPARYNSKTELTYDVTPEGTDKANFDLK
jgi:hypothetical protein